MALFTTISKAPTPLHSLLRNTPWVGGPGGPIHLCGNPIGLQQPVTGASNPCPTLRTGPLLCSSSTLPYGIHMTIRAGVPVPLLQPHGCQYLPPLNIRHSKPRAALSQLSIQLPPNLYLVSSEGNPGVGQQLLHIVQHLHRQDIYKNHYLFYLLE